MSPSQERDRKAEHIQLALDEGMQVPQFWFDLYYFPNQALPEIAIEEIALEGEFVGRRIAAPLLISCMTGGTEEASRINSTARSRSKFSALTIPLRDCLISCLMC